MTDPELLTLMEAARLLGWRQARTYYRSRKKARPQKRIRTVKQAVRAMEAANAQS